MVGENIKCGLFARREPGIKALAARLDAPGRCPAQKARLAAKLLQETEPLLACRDFSGWLPDCETCRGIASRRRLAAELVLRRAAAFGAGAAAGR